MRSGLGLAGKVVSLLAPPNSTFSSRERCAFQMLMTLSVVFLSREGVLARFKKALLWVAEEASRRPLGELGGGTEFCASSIAANTTCGPPSPPAVGGGLGGASCNPRLNHAAWRDVRKSVSCH